VNISIKKQYFCDGEISRFPLYNQWGNRRSWYKKFTLGTCKYHEAIANAGDIAITGNRKAVTIMRKRQQVLKMI
jgi:hypothetical protein